MLPHRLWRRNQRLQRCFARGRIFFLLLLFCHRDHLYLYAMVEPWLSAQQAVFYVELHPDFYPLLGLHLRVYFGL